MNKKLILAALIALAPINGCVALPTLPQSSMSTAHIAIGIGLVGAIKFGYDAYKLSTMTLDAYKKKYNFGQDLDTRKSASFKKMSIVLNGIIVLTCLCASAAAGSYAISSTTR